MSLADVMDCIIPGLWRWTAPHPDWSPYDPEEKTGFGWSRQVGCVCYEAPSELVLIDPLAPPPASPECRRFWQALDAAVERKRQPVTVLLSTDWHDRSAQAVFDRYACRYGASIRVHEAMPRDSLNCRPTHTFSAEDPLPGDVRFYFLTSPHPEVVFYLSSARSLVIADALWGTPDGRLWLGSREFCALLPSLLQTLPLDTVLLSHGEPILADARAVLARVVEERPEWRGDSL